MMIKTRVVYFLSYMVIISLYTISADCHACLPDMQAQTLKSIHFLKPLLKGVVPQKTEFDFMAHVPRTKPNSVEQLFEPKFYVVLQFHKFLGAMGKRRSSLKIRIDDIFEKVCCHFPQFLLFKNMDRILV